MRGRGGPAARKRVATKSRLSGHRPGEISCSGDRIGGHVRGGAGVCVPLDQNIMISGGRGAALQTAQLRFQVGEALLYAAGVRRGKGRARLRGGGCGRVRGRGRGGRVEDLIVDGVVAAKLVRRDPDEEQQHGRRDQGEQQVAQVPVPAEVARARARRGRGRCVEERAELGGGDARVRRGGRAARAARGREMPREGRWVARETRK